MRSAKRCVVCAAKARGLTCGTICTRAREAGTSREAQLAQEMEMQRWTADVFNYQGGQRQLSCDSGNQNF